MLTVVIDRAIAN